MKEFIEESGVVSKEAFDKLGTTSGSAVASNDWVSPVFPTETLQRCQMKKWEYWFLKLFKKPTVDDVEHGLEFYRWKDKIYVIEKKG